MEKIQKVSIDTLIPYWRNPRMNNEAIVHLAQSIKDYGFNQPIIVNDIESAALLYNCPCPTRKIYYAWDLEWIYDESYNLNKYHKIYHSFEIIVRSQTHYNIFKKVWKEPNYLIEDFNYEQIRDLFITK